MIETALISFTTFFAVIAPFECAAVFIVLTPSASQHERRAMAIRGTIVATIILFLFALFGEFLLNILGISLAALKVAGGILLLLIGIDMVFARPSGGTTTTQQEVDEAKTSNDISVVPLATPIIAGPGAMGAAILLMANVRGEYIKEIVVMSSMSLVLLITFSLLLLTSRYHHFIKVTVLNVIGRIFGVLLTALAVQFIFDGIAQSGLL